LTLGKEGGGEREGGGGGGGRELRVGAFARHVLVQVSLNGYQNKRPWHATKASTMNNSKLEN